MAIARHGFGEFSSSRHRLQSETARGLDGWHALRTWSTTSDGPKAKAASRTAHRAPRTAEEVTRQVRQNGLRRVQGFEGNSGVRTHSNSPDVLQSPNERKDAAALAIVQRDPARDAIGKVRRAFDRSERD